MSVYLGIDFGTSTNIVTRWDEGKKRAELVPLGAFKSPNIFPNVIFYESPQYFFVGEPAVTKAKIYMPNGVFNIKRDLEKPDFRHQIPALGRSLSSEEIGANIFSWIKREVESKFGGEQVDGVVISVPFAFKNRERKRIEHAAQEAGLNVLGLIEEPVAAALSFGLIEKAKSGEKEKILVFDLGGGTFDVTIFEFIKYSKTQFEIKVIATDGAKHLGGIDIDDLIVSKILEKLAQKFKDYNLDLRAPNHQRKEVDDIRQLAVELKEALSEDEEFDFFFSSNFDDNFYIEETISADDLKRWLRPFLTEIENTLDDALISANLEPDDIDRIIMVGGTSNIPAVKELVEDYFQKEPEEVGDMRLMVGQGAGIYCGLRYIEKSIDCKISIGVSQSISLRKPNGSFQVMLERNTLYGTPSKIFELKISNPGSREIVVPIFQGSGSNPEKVASFPVTEEVQNRLSAGVIGVRLNTDANNGTILYELYDMIAGTGGKFKTGSLLEKDKAGEF